jgi:Trk-type K+ transport system membrane component
MPSKESIQQFRERINLRLFASKHITLGILTWGTLLFSLAALVAIVYYYGYQQTAESLKTVHLVIRASIWFYILKFIIRVIYDFHPGQFIRENRLDTIVFVGMVFAETFQLLFGSDFINHIFIGWMNIRMGDISILAVQLYFLIIVGIELGKAAVKVSQLKIPPVQLMAISFVGLISFGALLLMLPEMTTGDGISFIDALFTSTSAVCVTGLTVVDTAIAFTHKGHWIILILIQLGGLNILAFAAFFAIFYKDSSSIKYQSLLKDLLDTSEMSKSRSILGKIFLFSFVIEAIGIALVYFSWGRNAVFPEGQTRFFSSMFHCISAFNNAGFSLFTDNFYDQSVRLNWTVQGVIALLVFLGGIGYPVLQDVTGLHKKGLHFGFWKYLQPGSRVALRTSFFLIVGGAIMFYFFYPVYPDDVTVGGRIVQGVFHSVIARTAGFNSVDMSQFSQVLILVFIGLMFIGASPGSTGGGIKTTTFAVLMKSIFIGIRGNKNLVFFQHSLKTPLITRAVSVTVLYACFFMIGTTLLAIFEPHIPMGNLAFEQVSALSTVGLSTGITAGLTTASKWVLVTSMYVGRIGSLTIVMALLKRVQTVQFTYSHTNILIG